MEGTKDCEIYMSNRFTNIFWDDIVVIDTPGLESKSTVSLIAKDIDYLITKYKLHIAGIAYVIDIMQREQDQEGGNYIFTLLDFLRVKYCYKINLLFCILSKFDRNYDYEDLIENMTRQLSRLFQDHGYSKL